MRQLADAADGAGNASLWLRARTNTDHGAAALAHAARRLADLPRLRAHLAAGDVTLTDAGAGTPAPDQPQPRPARLGSGATLHPAAVRGLLGCATILAVLTLGPWRAVNVGATHRTLPAWLRAVLAAMHQRPWTTPPAW